MEECYLESKRETQPAAPLSLRSSPVSLSPIIMEGQLLKMKLFSTASSGKGRLGF